MVVGPASSNTLTAPAVIASNAGGATIIKAESDTGCIFLASCFVCYFHASGRTRTGTSCSGQERRVKSLGASSSSSLQRFQIGEAILCHLFPSFLEFRQPHVFIFSKLLHSFCSNASGHIKAVTSVS